MNVLAALTALAVITSGSAMGASALTTDPDIPVLESPVVSEILEDSAVGEEVGDTVVTDTADGTVTIPIDSGVPVTLVPDAGPALSITLPQAPTNGSSESAPESSAVVHDLHDGTVILPLVKDDGTVQILSVIHAPDAPHTFTYELDAAGGVALQPLPDGGAAVVGGDGEELASIAAPWAVDAAGVSVPTWFTLDGGTLVQHVDPAPDASYPIVADPALTQTRYEYKYVNVSRTSNYTNRSVQLGICKVTTGGGGTKCAISNSYSVQTTVTTSFSLTKGAVGAGIGIDASRTASGSVSCTSPALPVGSSYKAWAVGTRVVYQIQKWKVVKAGGRTIRSLQGTSGRLVAFSPVTGFACGQ